MSKLKKKLDRLKQDKIEKRWEKIETKEGLSTREKLDKLVKLSIKREGSATPPSNKNENLPSRADDSRERTRFSSIQNTGRAAHPANNKSEAISSQSDGYYKKTSFAPNSCEAPGEAEEAVIVRDFSYPLSSVLGGGTLEGWRDVSPEQLAVIFADEEFLRVSPQQLLFFDTETTGLSGGTGTIPFLLGFGFFAGAGADPQPMKGDETASSPLKNRREETSVSPASGMGGHFQVRIFFLNDLSKEEEFLDEVDRFLESGDFSGVVTYNGKSYDYPIMETRYILHRKRFPLLKKPHLDFLYPARTLWKHTYESRGLGYLGDVLLGLSRQEDIDSSQVPALYFDYLRTNNFSLIEKVIEHNALDLLGLAALLLLGAKYAEDVSFAADEGEMLGTAMLYEKYGDLEKANELYGLVKESAGREDVLARAAKRKAVIVKKKKLYQEARELWEYLSNREDRFAFRELSVHFEHREKDYVRALDVVRQGLAAVDLTEAQRRDFEKRLQRLQKKIAALDDKE